MAKRSIWIWTAFIFISLIVLQHRYVGMYFDDYGYAGLTYNWSGNAHGMQYTLTDILSFLKFHYLNWGGRVQYLFYEIILFRVGGLRLIQTVQALLVVLVCFFAGNVAARLFHCDTVTGVSVMFALYGVFSIGTLHDGVYWYSASALYVWPLLPFFLGLNFVLIPDSELTVAGKVFCVLLLFLASFSQEQTAVMTVVTVGGSAGMKILGRKKKERDCDVVYQLCQATGSLVGAALCILAPGNFVRAKSSIYDAFYGQHFISRTAVNCAKLLNNNFGKHNWLFVIVFTFFVGMLLYLHFNKKEIIIVAAVFFCYFVIEKIVSFPLVADGAVRAVWALLFIPAVVFFYYRKGETLMLWLLCGGICSQLMMVVLPGISPRCHTMFEFVLDIVLVHAVVTLISWAQKGQAGQIVFCSVSLALLLAVSTANMIYIMEKYKANYEVLEVNHAQMLAAKDQEEGSSVTLYRLKDDNYANIMPYKPGYEFIESWMKRFYEVPDSLVIRWEEPGQ